MIRCYITGRSELAPGSTLLNVIERNLNDGVEWIQIREKDLTSRELFSLVEAALRLPNPHGTSILVNTRVDVALAAGAHGAHLPSSSPAPCAWRSVTPPGFLLGVSCHSIEELRQAESDGADYAVYGPIFAPLSKSSSLPPLGLEGLKEAAASVRIPVLALGGITRNNSESCIEAGAAGVAGITLFQNDDGQSPL